MPVYKYTAVNHENKRIKGEYKCSTPSQLYNDLAIQDIYVKSYWELDEEYSQKKKLPSRQLSVLCNQLATMLNSGMSLSKSLELLYNSERKARFRKLYLQLYENVQKGYTLSEAMGKCDVIFSPYLIQMVSSGEKSGALEKNLQRMSVYYEKEYKMHNKLVGAMTYPIILFGLTVVVVIGLMTFVMPRFVGLFNGAELPWNTKLLIAMSNFMVNNYILLTIASILIVMAIRFFFRLPKPRYAWDRFKMKVVLFGPLYATILTSRFARTFASLYASGIPVLGALEITAEVVSNTYVSKGLENVAEKLKKGNSLSSAIKEEEMFNPLLHSMLYVGEESGNLPELLESTSNYFDEASDSATEKLVTWLQPIMIIIMALVIGFVLFSVIIPIYSMMGNVA